MRKIKKVWQGFCDESLEAKIRYMLSLFLLKRYAQGLGFGEFMRVMLLI